MYIMIYRHHLQDQYEHPTRQYNSGRRIVAHTYNVLKKCFQLHFNALLSTIAVQTYFGHFGVILSNSNAPKLGSIGDKYWSM